MKEFWNERFEKEEFIYGTEPNSFLESELKKINRRGKALFPLEGEGRNACYASKLGWKVEAFDFSEAGKEKADRLCGSRGIPITYTVSSLQDYEFTENKYDLVALIFAHVNPALRAHLHDHAVKSLKPGGKLILEAFHPNQLSQHFTSGGPKNPEMLYSFELLKKDFIKLSRVHGEELEIELTEGDYHVGKGFVTRLTGVK